MIPPVEQLRRARDAFDSYLRLPGERRFMEAAQQLEALSRSLRQLGEDVGIPEGG